MEFLTYTPKHRRTIERKPSASTKSPGSLAIRLPKPYGQCCNSIASLSPILVSLVVASTCLVCPIPWYLRIHDMSIMGGKSSLLYLQHFRRKFW